MAKFADHMDKIAESVTEGYQKIEDGVVGGYKKMETGIVEGFGKLTGKASDAMLNEDGSLKTGKVGEHVVSGYQRIENAFVNTFIARDGESVEDAKARLAAGQKARDEQMQADMENRAADQKAMIEASLEASRNAHKHP